ncbi:hypothetical protein PHAVU_005G105700 [Phaseolus vulgaris]|uniref:Uncharacterized protein n=1 Tax=Phaseolus vulgaris TaxID=3885 RepID=V7BXU2_PHAVU|nr:hypothetical protein PHAVU_005G105700g [Phaseolus vulgaris]ESW21865.1 hypothetical protein PHAVU_005G105700g [Phaseolus vulgaris]
MYKILLFKSKPRFKTSTSLFYLLIKPILDSMKPPHNYTQRCSVAMLSFPTKIVLQIKQDDKFFSKLLSKENSMSKPSFRMVVAVPFVWESQPGTPKYTFFHDTFPPLTPPPSYYANPLRKTSQ